MTNAAAVFKKAKKSVVVVRVFDADDNQFAQGSGVITAENEVTTNYHVVEKAKRVEVFQEGEGKAIVAKVSHIQFAVGRDLCLLSVNGLTDAAEIRDAKNLKVGEDVFAIGSPQGLEFSITSGIVSQLRPLGGLPPWIQTDAAISKGSSGGGLFDGEGKLVGITTFYYKDGQNLNFAIPSEWIADARLNQSPFSESASQISAGSSLDFHNKALELQEVEDWNGILAHCKEWIEAEPGNPDALYVLGIAYGKLDHHDDAIAAYREAVRINPELAEAWNNLGVAYSNINRYDDAVAALREALRINPEDADAWNNLGNTYNDLGRHDDAIAALREALRINPELAEAWNNLGVTYSNIDHYDDAIAAFREAVRINPEDAESWNNLGLAYGKLDRYDDAIAALREALRINPELAIAWNNLGTVYGKLDRYDDAIAAYREALRINPELSEAWNNLGATYGELRRYDDAIAAFREALRIKPEDAEVWKNLSTAYRQAGRNAEADEANQKYLRAKMLSEK